MSDPHLPIEQLLELLITLKKTTPAAARTILNSQPAIAYALITLMVSMNAINVEVFQKILAEAAPQAAPLPAAVPAPVPTPIPAIPPHMQNLPPASSYRHTPTPPHHTPTPPYGPLPTAPPPAGYPPSSGYQSYPGYAPPPAHAHAPGGYPPMPAYGAPTVPPVTGGNPLPPALQETLANIPDEQKATIYRVLSATPEQINALPPHERNTYLQIRASLGFSA